MTFNDHAILRENKIRRFSPWFPFLFRYWMGGLCFFSPGTSQLTEKNHGTKTWWDKNGFERDIFHGNVRVPPKNHPLRQGLIKGILGG